MFCSECGNFAANKAIRQLKESGQVGHTETQRTPAIEPMTIPTGSTMERRVQPYADYLIDGAKYIVSFGGKSFEAIGNIDANGWFRLGNASLDGSSGGPDTGEMFFVIIKKTTSPNIANQIYLSFTPSEDLVFTVNLVAETIHTIDPKYLPESSGGMAIFKMSDYGIDMIDILMSGQTVTAHDCTALVADASKALLENKVPVLYDEGAESYAVVGAISPYVQISGSLFGDMGGAIIKADVVITKNCIYMFTSELPIE